MFPGLSLTKASLLICSLLKFKSPFYFFDISELFLSLNEWVELNLSS